MPYFDHNATTPLATVAREAWLRASDETWQNPSSPYRDSARARIRLDGVREHFAQLLGCDPKLLVFNSGATEGANAVFAHWAQTLTKDATIAVNPTEHPCVIEAAKQFFGERVVWLRVTRHGVVDLDALKDLLSENGEDARPPIAAIAVMAANNETGVLQPWTEIAQCCRDVGVPYFCDASQWLGKLPASGLGACDWLIGAAHKFGGPKGVGFLKLPESASQFRSQHGGEQEHGHRGGTENLPGATAMVAALAEAEQKKVFQETERVRWRQGFEHALSTAVPGVQVVGSGAERLWNTVSLLLPHTENHRWVTRLDKLGFQISTGSACATGKQGPSHVLAAMGYTAEEAKRVARVSSGWETTEADWQGLSAAFAKVDAEFRGSSQNVVNA